MESYQSIGLLMGIAGLILGIVGSAVIGSLGLWVAVVSFIGIVVPLVNTKHHKNVGIVLIVLGYNWEPSLNNTRCYGTTLQTRIGIGD